MRETGCSRRAFFLSVASLVRARGQTQAEATFSTDVKVVNVLATVRAKKGEIIHNLSKDDFALSENGKPQMIRYFARETDLPLTLGLMVDTSMSQVKVLDAERGASLTFLDQMLREGKDKVFIQQFDTVVVMRQDLTSSFRKLSEALAWVDTPTRREIIAQQGGGTLLYDAVVQASAVMKEQRDRKALIVLTDGVDVGSEGSLGAAIEAAQRADTLVYSILFSDEGAYGFLPFGHPDGRGVLMRLSRETGGGFFEVSKKLSIERIFASISDELRSQYNLGFVSDQPVRVSEFRKLQLTAKPKGLIVQARDEYWAKR
jgi:VWFA-related protein